MNKILKCLLGVLWIFLIGINLCNAWTIETTITNYNGTYNDQSVSVWNNDFVCVQLKNGNWQFYYNFDHWNTANRLQYPNIICVDNWSIYYTATSCVFDIIYWNEIAECEQCEEQYTSLECQTEYNLIPINSVTKSYCELNFNLIDPSTCPTNEGNWVVNWSSLFINNTQYAWNDTIELFIPDFIWWSIIYNSWTNYIDIEWYNADTSYIENVIDNTKVTPTPEDATLLVNGLANFIPYVFIAMIISFALILINKLFKS